MHRTRVVFSGVQGAPYYCNMFFSDSDATQACLDATIQFWEDVADQIVSACDWVVEDEVAIVSESSGEITEFNTGVGDVGTGTAGGEMLPPATQQLVQWRTALISGGRRVLGRTFIPAITDVANNEGVVASASQTVVQNAAQALIDDVNTHFGIYSRTHHAFAPATSAAAWNQFAQLRSRRD